MQPAATTEPRRPFPVLGALFAFCTTLPFILFCVRSYQSDRPIEGWTLAAFYLSGLALLISQKRLRVRAFRAPQGRRQWLQCGAAGLVFGFVLLFMMQLYERLASAPAVNLAVGIGVCVQWLLPFGLVALGCGYALEWFKKKTGRAMFTYSIVDLWAAMVGLAPGMLLARERFDFNIVMLMFISQCLGMAAGKALYAAYRPTGTWYGSLAAILAGALLGLAGAVGPVHYLLTGQLLM